MEQNPNPPSWPWISSSSSSSHLSFDLAQIDDNDDDHEHRQSDYVVGPGPETVREEDREPMFEKSLTPSDVGKLNRLVIPKQHAEKHFPLGGGAAADKGFLLGFEDESGKPWRFRYSYWNSSQSYVLTKGWSRFVKEKRLNAGDVILFYRHCLDPARFFIGWRRRGGPATAHDSAAAAAPWTSRGPFYAARPYPPPYHHQPPQPDHYPHAAGPAAAQIQATTNPMGSPKRLRLFGVNLECQPDGPEPSGADASEQFGPDGPAVLSQGSVREQFYAQMYASSSSSSNHPYHTDLNFSRDINQMRNRRGG